MKINLLFCKGKKKREDRVVIRISTYYVPDTLHIVFTSFIHIYLYLYYLYHT